MDRSLLETECQLDRNRIAELEGIEDRQKEEIQSLMRTNLNMQDRVDAAELQVNSLCDSMVHLQTLHRSPLVH